MSEAVVTESPSADPSRDEPAGGSYEVIRKRLVDAGAELGRRANALNAKRHETFGGKELTVIGNERVRTENNCVPRDIINVGGKLLFGYNVFMGLKTETKLEDVFSLHAFEANESGFGLSKLEQSAVPNLLDDATFTREFEELYQYYKETRLIQLRMLEGGRLLAVFQTGGRISDFKAFRWAVTVSGEVTYVDNRGERDHVFPPTHDFEWIPATRDDQVPGRHPHVNILNEVFVETVGGDLTIKVEDNTEDGRGIYSEQVEDPRQSLDDAEFHYAKVGGLVLIKALPYQEKEWRHLVYNSRTQSVRRLDAIGQACIQLPEDHGIIFPGGYYLQSGETKTFDNDIEDLRFDRVIRSPNGEDVLYVFYHEHDGRYLLLPYNLIRKEVQTPLEVNGYTLFDDGKMIILRAQPEPTRVHNMQIWDTPFTSDDHAAREPVGDSHLEKVGNKDLVRGISDCLSIRRLATHEHPNRQIFEDLIKAVDRAFDAYYWLGHEEVGGLADVLEDIRRNAELIIDEFEKVQTLQARARDELEAARQQQVAIVRELRPEDWRDVSPFLDAMTQLRAQRGHLITLKDVRYVDLDALQELEDEAVGQFDRVSAGCVRFLLSEEAMAPLQAQIESLIASVSDAQKALELDPMDERLQALSEGLNLLSEVVSGLEIEDPSDRTRILESISEVFGSLNRARALVVGRRKELGAAEGRAEFSAQFKLLSQAVSSALALADTPERCDEQLSRVMVQLEELEGRFGALDEFLADLATKREEIYDAFNGKKQQLLDDRQRRASNLATAAGRILEGMKRRTSNFSTEDELNAYFASDPMLVKARQLVEQLRELGDPVKADDVDAQIKSARQEALRNLKDKTELFEGGGDLIKLGKHRFSVNTQPFELTMVPRGEDMYFHVTGTDFFERVSDAEFLETREFWSQPLRSETREVYRSEFLAASILFDAENERGNVGMTELLEAGHDESELSRLVQRYAADRYEDGYERGLHDADATKILERLMTLQRSAGLLRFSPPARAFACLYWAHGSAPDEKAALHRRAMSLGRLRQSFTHSPAENDLAQDLYGRLVSFVSEQGIEATDTDLRIAGRYLVHELAAEHPRFTTSAEARRLTHALLEHLDLEGHRRAFDEDLSVLNHRLSESFRLALAWIDAFLQRFADSLRELWPVRTEAAVLLMTSKLDREDSAALTHTRVEGLLGQHPRTEGGAMELRLDEFLTRLTAFREERVPGFDRFRKLRHRVLERERTALRLDELKPRVLSSFVRNKLINDVYLPMIGDNLAKQLGAAGDSKRTDLMGMLLLISPPGYGKTTLMEYVASRLGMVFMKVNGPSLGHSVVSLDPSEAPNATARQEVEKMSLAFEMANNVLLYLDDIQHTHPELLQKFISLCDGQRRIEGVYKGRTQTYDLRGKKFAVVMAGNPYTESGEKFQIPDMLANRADTYNLGDVLEGRDEVFALSYLENSFTSNPTLAPVATRSLSDLQLFIRMAKGDEVATTDFEHSYAQIEVEEILQTLRHLFAVQEVLLKVNLQYIESASQDDRFRTEPPFKLQGSYRNMNKLAEKVVPAMTPDEIQQLITDHYVGESQTLTSGAEQNLLKLAEMRGRLTREEAKRWEQIKRDFRRLQVAGGADDDPVVRVTSTLGSLGEHLHTIGRTLDTAVNRKEDLPEWLPEVLARMKQLGEALDGAKQAEASNPDMSSVAQSLEAHLRGLEQVLIPLARSSVEHMEQTRALGQPLKELVELMRWNALRDRAPLEPPESPPESDS